MGTTTPSPKAKIVRPLFIMARALAHALRHQPAALKRVGDVVQLARLLDCFLLGVGLDDAHVMRWRAFEPHDAPRLLLFFLALGRTTGRH